MRIALNLANLNSLSDAVVDPDELAVMMLDGVAATPRLLADSSDRPSELSTILLDVSEICLFDPRTERRIE
jgi:hypothetical protein